MILLNNLSVNILKKTTIFLAFAMMCASSYADTPNKILTTTLTFYKNGALIHQGQTLSLSVGKHLMHVTGIANSIIKESLMLSLSAQPTEATIQESTFTKAEDDHTYMLDLLIDSNVQEPKNFVNLTYLLRDMGWKPDYTIQFRSGYQYLFFNGSIEVTNNSGIVFKNAQVQFVDGQIPSIQGLNTHKDHVKAKGYSYKNLLDILDKQPKRLNWISSKDTLKVKREYRISVGGEYLQDMNGKSVDPVIETWVSFHNTSENNLGQDLPPGPVILYYQDEQGNLEMLGSTNLTHTGVGQEISVRIPSTQIDKIEKNHKKESECIKAKLEQNQFLAASNTAQYCLKLTNIGKTPINVRVVLDLPDDVESCTIIRDTIPHEDNVDKTTNGTSDDTVHWNIKIPAESDVQLKYQLSFIKKTKQQN